MKTGCGTWIGIIVVALTAIFCICPKEATETTKELLPPPPSQEEINIATCERIAKKYNETHTYIPNNIFDCNNMACDIWNQLITAGINTEIVVGNLEKKPPYKRTDINHAWLYAEIAPDKWIAIECTTGKIVYGSDSEPYSYYAVKFKNPKELDDFFKR